MYRSEFDRVIEPRVDQIETMIKRLGRRAVKTKSAIITPYPISSCVTGEDVRGDILKYMFCCSGVISKGGIFLNAKPKSGASVTIKLDSEDDGMSRVYTIEKKKLIVDPVIEVSVYDRLTVSFSPKDPEEKITEVWISLLWIPNVKDAKIKNFLIDELEGTDVHK